MQLDVNELMNMQQGYAVSSGVVDSSIVTSTVICDILAFTITKIFCQEI